MLEDWEDFYFIDPDDEEYKEILNNARRRLERPHGSRDAVWKTSKHRENERKAEDWQ